MGKYFGTDGIRGEANDSLTVDIALKVGEYLGALHKGKKIIVRVLHSKRLGINIHSYLPTVLPICTDRPKNDDKRNYQSNDYRFTTELKTKKERIKTLSNLFKNAMIWQPSQDKDN